VAICLAVHTKVADVVACRDDARMLHLPLRLAYRTAHLGLRAYWRIRKPETQGALAVIFCRGQLLVLQTTYRDAVSLPGGYVKKGETPEVAVAREVREEVGFNVEPGAFKHVYRGTKPFEHRKDTLDLFRLELDARPVIKTNRAEIAWARWKSPEEVLAMPNVVPHLRDYLSSLKDE